MQLAYEKTINFSRLGEVCTTRASGFLGRLFLHMPLQRELKIKMKNQHQRRSRKVPYGGRLIFSLQRIDFV